MPAVLHPPLPRPLRRSHWAGTSQAHSQRLAQVCTALVQFELSREGAMWAPGEPRACGMAVWRARVRVAPWQLFHVRVRVSSKADACAAPLHPPLLLPPRSPLRLPTRLSSRLHPRLRPSPHSRRPAGAATTTGAFADCARVLHELGPAHASLAGQAAALAAAEAALAEARARGEEARQALEQAQVGGGAGLPAGEARAQGVLVAA